MINLNQSIYLFNTKYYLHPRIVGTALLMVCFFATISDGYTKPKRNHHYPSYYDPSRYTGPQVGDLPEDLPEANQGTFEGGYTETITDTHEANVLQGQDQREDGKFNVPTNGAPSPLYGASPFSQQMLRFEEFGTKRLKLWKKKPPRGLAFVTHSV